MYEQATVATGKVQQSSLNPRKHFDKVKLDELTASVRVQGVLQPLLVRVKPPGWEVVCGERRRRAALAAGLKEIPVVIGKLDDGQALELMLIENGQRADVHPLEEADGYQALQKLGRSVEQIAAKLGKSTSHVYQRLRLCALVKEVRDAFWEGKLDAAGAQEIAKIHSPTLQAKAIGELLERWRGEPIPVDDAKDHVRARYMLVLAQAPFSIGDAKLIPAAGACGDCPKRTGAQKELFADDTSKADMCLDPDCYRKKADAAWQRAASQAEEGGAQVLSDADSKKAFPYGNASLAYGSGYARLSDPCEDDPKRRTYKTLLGAAVKKQTLLARDGHGGVHELVKMSDAIPILKAAGHKEVVIELQRDAKQHEGEAARRKKDAADASTRRALTTTVITEIARFMTKLELDVPAQVWRLIAERALENAHNDTHSFVVKRRQLEEKGKRPEAILAKHIESLPPAKLPAIVLELLVTQNAYYSYSDKLADGVQEAAKVLSVDVKGIKRAVDMAAKEKAEKKKKKAA